METLNLDQLFLKIRYFHNEGQDFTSLKDMFDKKILNDSAYETKLYQNLKIITSTFPNKNIRILDYGCGGGKLLFFFI